MSETLTVLVKEVTSKQGETNGRAWTQHKLIDSNGHTIGSSFDTLNATPGAKVEVTREKKGDFWNITDVKPAADNAEVTPSVPAIRAKTDPDDERGINARRALQDAVVRVAALSDTDSVDALTEAERYFDWLMSKSQAAEPEKPAQSVPDTPTQEQRDELSAIIEKLNTHSPKQQGQKSWTEDLGYFAEHTFGKTKDLSRAEFQQLIDYGHGLERDQALPFS